MEIEIVRKHENALLKRTDVTFKVTHPKEKTPQRQTVRDKLAATVGSPREGVIIQFMRSHFGVSTTEGFAKCYPTAEAAKKTEPQYLLVRHGLVEAKKEAAGEKKEAAPPPPPPKKEEKAAAPAPAPHKKEEKPAAAPHKKEEKPAHAPAKEEKPAEKKK